MARATMPTDDLQDRPAYPAEVVFLVIMIVLTALVSLAGVPASAEKVAGDGSDHLRRNWAASLTAAPPAAEPSAGRGLSGG